MGTYRERSRRLNNTISLLFTRKEKGFGTRVRKSPVYQATTATVLVELE